MPDALRLATLAVAAVALLGTATAGHAQEPIRIGVLQPMTGPATKNGTENFTAMQIAREMINERGGINGRKVEFLLADIPTPTAAISETERLTTKDGVKITLGSGVSLLAVPVSQAAERHGVFHWERRVQPTSSPNAASSTRSRSARRPTAMARQRWT